MAKVRKFSTGLEQDTPKPAASLADNVVPNIPSDVAETVAASAPVQIKPRRGNPRQRRYKQKTYSLLQEDIDLIEQLVQDIRSSGLYERGRSDIVRAGVRLLQTLSAEDRVHAIQKVESLRQK